MLCKTERKASATGRSMRAEGCELTMQMVDKLQDVDVNVAGHAEVVDKGH